MGIANLDFIRRHYVEPRRDIGELQYHDVSVCTPLYNSMPFIDEYLFHMLNYDWPRERISLLFTVQGDDGTYRYMKQFQRKHEKQYKRIKVKKVKQVKNIELPHVYNVVRCRKLLASWSKPDEYVFFNDHDNFDPPISIKRLIIALHHGASIAGGVYVFFTRNQWEPEGHIGFTAFFMNEGMMHHYAIDKTGFSGTLPTEMLNKYVWCDAVAMGACLVKREVLDNVDFFIPYGSTMTDDTAFCLKAREYGYKVIADFGLLVKHWGYDVTLRHRNDGRLSDLSVDRQSAMLKRRRKMYYDGVYVHPDVDVGINKAVRGYINLDKIIPYDKDK